MPDQSPAKPKPGSLRDRIAAFEKTSTASAPAAPAPAPRPKPAGFSTWKPKPTSRPSSPTGAQTEHAAASSGGMSASDAKESITKGGSLKDRMAALQGKGAFGAPPPVAPKPTVERPKWKPPPAVSPPADDDDHAPKQDADSAIAAAIGRSTSPPVAPKPASLSGGQHSRKSSLDVSSPQPPTGTEGEQGSSATTDPEEEERQRRTALAARMARLGGARLGMAPPIIGKKPPVRKATQEEHAPAEVPRPSEHQGTSASASPKPVLPDTPAVVAEPTGTPSADASSSPEQRRQSTDYFTDKKEPENSSALTPGSVDSSASKSPSSMPIPSVPRRTGPPRKKPAKPSAPPPEVPEEKLTETIPALETTLDKRAESTVEEPLHTADVPQSPPDSLTVASEQKVKDQDHQDFPLPANTSPELTRDESTEDSTQASSEPATESGIIPPPPSHVTKDTSPDEVDEDIPGSSSTNLLRTPSEAIPSLEAIAAAEEEYVATPVAEDEIDEATEEEARKKRVAERLAKMGGVNPFAAQLPKVTSPPIQDVYASDDDQTPLKESISLPEAPTQQAFTEESRDDDLHAETESEGSVYEDAEVASVDDNGGIELAEPQSPPPLPASRPPIPTSPPTAKSIDKPQPSRQTSVSSEPGEAPAPPARQVQPPRRIVPRTPSASDDAGDHEDEDQSEVDGSVSQTGRFIPPPPESHEAAPHPGRRFVQDEDDFEGNGSETDSPALPVPHRRSIVEAAPARSIPQVPTDDYSETESDHDGQALPIPPRQVASPPTIVASPPPTQETFGHDGAPSIHDLTPTSLTVRREVLDEEEGDPIDPSFHSPSRRASFVDLPAVAQEQSLSPAHSPPVRSPPALPTQLPVRKQTDPAPHSVEEVEAEQPAEDAEALRRRTIAERMAKLGGIKFGGAPPVPGHRPAPAPAGQDQNEEAPAAEATENDAPTELTEEEEERARKERIAAKLAHMGGMRIGMMPVGMGGLPPQRSHILHDEPSSPPQPTVSSPPRQTRLPPPPPGPETEMTSAPSDDSAWLEAEGRETEEPGHQEAEPEAPPPVPSRTGRQAHRRESTDTTTSQISSGRPPVPAPHKRSSIQSTTERPLPQRKESSQQADFVMVEEGDHEEAPPLPPGRPGPRSPPQPGVQNMSASQDLSSWEIPEFESHTDLALSWTDAGESAHAAQPQPPAKQPKPVPMDKTMSADELMALWGRVGVQVCEVATTLYDKSKKGLVGDGTYSGFVKAVLADVPGATVDSIDAGQYGYLIYSQNGPTVQKRVSDIMPGDLVELRDAKLKGHKGLQAYHQNVGSPSESVIGVVGEHDAKKSKIRVFQANQHVGQQTVESVSYRLEDLKNGTIKIYRVLDA